MICHGTVTVKVSGAVRYSGERCDFRDLETAALCHSVLLSRRTCVRLQWPRGRHLRVPLEAGPTTTSRRPCSPDVAVVDRHVGTGEFRGLEFLHVNA